MTRAVLVDTGPLYAAVDSSDQYHRRAQQELERLEHERIAVFLLYSNLLESYTLILRRLGIGVALGWLRE